MMRDHKIISKVLEKQQNELAQLYYRVYKYDIFVLHPHKIENRKIAGCLS